MRWHLKIFSDDMNHYWMYKLPNPVTINAIKYRFTLLGKQALSTPDPDD